MDKIRTTDQFFVYAKANISANDFQVLSLLYQPIIGVLAFSLYSTLWHLINRQNLMSDHYLHSDLESILNNKVAKIEDARHHLEAIGLMNVYFHNDCFAYEMKLPSSAASFINDGILGSYLQNCVTDSRYEKILKLFRIVPVNKTDFLNLTKSFNDVFPAIPNGKKMTEGEFIATSRDKSININNNDFDFRIFVEGFPDENKVRNLLSDAVKEKIVNLAYVYDLDETAMHTVFAKAIDETYSSVDLAKLSKQARDHFKFDTAMSEPILEVDEKDLQDGNPTNPFDYFGTIGPKKLLSQLLGGLVSDSDLRVVERLIEEIKLDKGVVNVLLAYTIKNNNGDMPPYAYYQKIGMSWKRNQINDVRMALDYVRHLNSEYTRNQNPAEKKISNRVGKTSKPEVKIDWLDDYLKSIK
ncbi:MAG: DnaD domain protein [Candidatus Izemoplasmatales bacterium]|jgi:replication initiation and membrane attachment protein|nr:DnaD domain protein [Candidatus Izemoplasmatales bacterium]MDD4595096.1 DnaD domain protein [Candidatus Izemoplasmatales bacterium]